jgi:polyisoprenoid-binding protein YceI
MSENGSVRYTLDAAASRLTVRAFASGLLSAFGHDPVIRVADFSGGGEFRPGAVEPASLAVKIRASSLAVTTDVNEGDRQEIERVMHQDVLESERFPDILFEATSVKAAPAGEGRYRATITGNLTLHGVTRPHTMPAQLILDGANVRAFGEFTVKQSDYGIKLVSVAGGGLKLKDELKCNFEILAQQAASAEKS